MEEKKKIIARLYVCGGAELKETNNFTVSGEWLRLGNRSGIVCTTGAGCNVITAVSLYRYCKAYFIIIVQKTAGYHANSFLTVSVFFFSIPTENIICIYINIYLHE